MSKVEVLLDLVAIYSNICFSGVSFLLIFLESVPLGGKNSGAG